MERTNETVYELLTKEELLEIRDKINEELSKCIGEQNGDEL